MKLGIYHHYKNKEYEVLGVAKDTDDLNDYVVYKALYDNNVSNLWIRKLDEFNETIMIDGVETPRFTFISDNLMMLGWNIYEITTKESSIKGVMLRGRIRKFALENNFNLLIENATDKENCVRFALLDKNQPEKTITFIKSLITDADIVLIEEGVKNPVLSKMKVNKEERYTI